MKVKNTDTVTLNYTGKLNDGEIFDSTIMEGREPMTVKLGQRSLISGFEEGLIGMEVGEKKTIELEPSKAYGDSNDSLIFEIKKEQLPPDVEVGHMLQGSGQNGVINIKVLEIKEDTAIVDANHPLAGKTLIFDLEVLAIG